MPSPEHLCRHQDAVLWRKTGVDNYGNTTVGDAEQITVRWDESVSNPSDPQKSLESKSITVIVDEEITLGSRMRLGSLDDYVVTSTNVMEVVAYNSVPDIKGREFAKSVTLQRYLA